VISRVRAHVCAAYIVSGGSNDKPPPAINPVLTQLEVTSNSAISEVRMVPNEPLVFSGDGKKRTEDAITAFSWEKFLTTSDEFWPLRLPMTKSVVRTMDTITSFCASPQGAASQSTGLWSAAPRNGGGRRGPSPPSTTGSPQSSLPSSTY
jgi:hypothetical protein